MSCKYHIISNILWFSAYNINYVDKSERGITVTANKENKIYESEEKLKNKSENIPEDNKVKGDIDDYIFSWQTIKYVSER